MQIWASLNPPKRRFLIFFLGWVWQVLQWNIFSGLKKTKHVRPRNSTLGLLTVYPVKSGSFPLLIFLTGKFKNGRKNATLCISLCILSVICLYLLKGALSNLVTGNFLFNPKLGQFREKLFSKKFHLFHNRLWIPKT